MDTYFVLNYSTKRKHTYFRIDLLTPGVASSDT